MRRTLIYFHRHYRRMVSLLASSILLSALFYRHTGSDYGIGIRAKLALIRKMYKNTRKIPTASHFLEHIAMATRIMNIPKNVEGCIVECGCYKGGSTANLSLVAALCNRKLEVFDSFAGLPEPSEDDKSHLVSDIQEIHTYSKGDWAGNFDEVRTNIANFGDISVCRFHQGYFDETLPKFKENVVFAFLDVDLTDSLRSCLTYLWRLLQDGCYLYTHEAHHLKISALFFDKAFWNEEMSCEAPGLIGAGSGIGLLLSDESFKSCIGYTIKNPESLTFKVNPQTGLRQA